MLFEPKPVELTDLEGNVIDVGGRISEAVITETLGFPGKIQIELKVDELAMPVPDETWTRADVRRLYQLLVKRGKILDKIKGVMTLEAIADLKCACAIDDLLREE